VANQVCNIHKSSTDIHKVTLLLVNNIKLKSVSQGQINFDRVSVRLPGGVAAAVDDCSFSQELLLAARSDKLDARVGRLLVVARVFDTHTTLDIYH
jgi:hypothetical protein